MNYYYRDFVIKNRIEIIEDQTTMFRYMLKVPFSHAPQNSVLVILKNPSVATSSESDHTINRICDYCYRKGFDEVYITNLFAYRAQDSKVLVQAAENEGDSYVIGEDNDKYIKQAKDKVNTIIIAWGEHPPYYKKQYLDRIKKVLPLINDKDIFYVGKLCTKEKYPLHAQPWGYNMPMEKYTNSL